MSTLKFNHYAANLATLPLLNVIGSKRDLDDIWNVENSDKTDDDWVEEDDEISNKKNSMNKVKYKRIFVYVFILRTLDTKNFSFLSKMIYFLSH